MTRNEPKATPAHYERLRSLGAHDAELTLMRHQGLTASHAVGLIAELGRYPIGTGALRHWRLIGDYPRGATTLTQLPIGERDAITAWRLTAHTVHLIDEAFDERDYERLDDAARLVGEIAELARAGHADAAGNGAIVDHIDSLGITLAGRVNVARERGALEARDYEAHVRALPEEIRRAAREWRALAGRQRERAARVRAARMAAAFRRAPSWRAL